MKRWSKPTVTDTGIQLAKATLKGESTLRERGPTTFIVGEITKPPRPWLEAKNAAGQEQQRMWQAQADDIWRQEPELKNSAVARRIDPQRWKYIRKRIRKPTK